MPKKAKPTKTINPLHFEDLDPHRFEDLVRNLIYDFKIWQSIEATGRGGGDDGFDVRAWERVQEVTNRGDKDEEEGIHPMEGNLWMIQCKRDKRIGPSKVKEIIEDGVNKKNPPYGYILVAPANFSKKSHDVFREELLKRGVMEFELWGRSKLEDMLYMSKNDHILFAFFGLSLVSKRRSRSSEIRFAVNNKNKLLRVLSGGDHWDNLHASILLRHFSDTHYPWKGKYKDFDDRPRWKEYIAVEYHPRGLIVDVKKRFAYFDEKQNHWDYTDAVDLLNRQSDREDNTDRERRRKVQDFWKHFPRKNQAELVLKGIIYFEDMLIIDDKGDVLYKYPHIFVDFKPELGPFRGFWSFLEVGYQKIDLDEVKPKRIKIFPEKFPEPKIGKLHPESLLESKGGAESGFIFRSVAENSLFDFDRRYSSLNVRDVISIPSRDNKEGREFVEVTYKYKTRVGDYLKQDRGREREIESQAGRKVKKREMMTVFELEPIYQWEIDRRVGKKSANR